MRKTGTLAAFTLALLMTTACDGGVSLPGTPKVSAHAIRQAADEPRVKAFYEARGWKAAWSESAAEDLLEAIAAADKHGIDADRFLAFVGQAPDAAHEEAGLTLAAISYAEALSMGMAEPKKVFGIYTLKRPEVDVAAGLNQALEKGEVGGWLESLAPQDDEYRTLSNAYVALRKQIAQSKAPPVPSGSTIKPGARDTRVPMIAAALHDAGFLAAPADPQATQYTAPMVTAIKGLQTEAGIGADGTIGNETIEALNSVLNDHAQQLALNLEHRRWLARDVPKTRVDVNTASALLDYYRNGALAHSSRVVVGKRGNETPQLGSTMFQLVANPPWNVPDGIAREEVLPKGPGYLASQGMYVENGRVVQRPGPKAALGEVKFDLENPYAIYLHDTPSKASFGTPYRHKSHGCVRVHNAVAFARMLAQEHGVLGEFDRKLASRDTGAVTLKDKIPVRLVYHTVFIDGAGHLVYLPDPYGWDEKLAASLGMKSPRRLRTDDGVTIPLGP
jgi:murein L,D-transpeptidase YcbB/YkuD